MTNHEESGHNVILPQESAGLQVFSFGTSVLLYLAVLLEHNQH